MRRHRSRRRSSRLLSDVSNTKIPRFARDDNAYFGMTTHGLDDAKRMAGFDAVAGYY
jgi:hypothetical protein